MWLEQAIKDNDCKTEKELYEKTYMETIQRKYDQQRSSDDVIRQTL